MAGKVKMMKCPRCHGSGEVMANTLPWRQREEGAFAACPHCKATGFTASPNRQDQGRQGNE